jgi:hypothetical protein
LLYTALKSFANALNAHIKSRFGFTQDRVQVANVKRPDDKDAGEANRITITLVNVREERNIKSQTIRPQERPIYLDLTILIAVYYGEESSYEQALRELSAVIGFLQANSVFTPQNTSGMEGNIEKIVFRLENMEIQNLQNMWAMTGGKFTPSVVYRAQLVAIDEGQAGLGIPLIGGL